MRYNSKIFIVVYQFFNAGMQKFVVLCIIDCHSVNQYLKIAYKTVKSSGLETLDYFAG